MTFDEGARGRLNALAVRHNVEASDCHPASMFHADHVQAAQDVYAALAEIDRLAGEVERLTRERDEARQERDIAYHNERARWEAANKAFGRTGNWMAGRWPGQWTGVQVGVERVM